MSIRFDGTSGKYLSRNSNILNNRADYTIMGWFYYLGVTGWQNCFFFNVASESMQLNGTKLNAWVGATGTDGTTTLSANTWYHFAAVRNTTNMRLFLNGNLEVTHTAGFHASSATIFYMGTWDASSDWPNCRMYAIKKWSAALTQAEIQNEIYSVVPRKFDSLHSWYPMFPGSGIRNLDFGANIYNYTVTGVVTDEDSAPISWGGGAVAVNNPVAAASPTNVMKMIFT